MLATKNVYSVSTLVTGLCDVLVWSWAWLPSRQALSLSSTLLPNKLSLKCELHLNKAVDKDKAGTKVPRVTQLENAWSQALGPLLVRETAVETALLPWWESGPLGFATTVSQDLVVCWAMASSTGRSVGEEAGGDTVVTKERQGLRGAAPPAR